MILAIRRTRARLGGLSPGTPGKPPATSTTGEADAVARAGTADTAGSREGTGTGTWDNARFTTWVESGGRGRRPTPRATTVVSGYLVPAVRQVAAVRPRRRGVRACRGRIAVLTCCSPPGESRGFGKLAKVGEVGEIREIREIGMLGERSARSGTAPEARGRFGAV